MARMSPCDTAHDDRHKNEAPTSPGKKFDFGRAVLADWMRCCSAVCSAYRVVRSSLEK